MQKVSPTRKRFIEDNFAKFPAPNFSSLHVFTFEWIHFATNDINYEDIFVRRRKGKRNSFLVWLWLKNISSSAFASWRREKSRRKVISGEVAASDCHEKGKQSIRRRKIFLFVPDVSLKWKRMCYGFSQQLEVHKLSRRKISILPSFSILFPGRQFSCRPERTKPEIQKTKGDKQKINNTETSGEWEKICYLTLLINGRITKSFVRVERRTPKAVYGQWIFYFVVRATRSLDIICGVSMFWSRSRRPHEWYKSY